jgi:hypothetical protein
MQKEYRKWLRRFLSVVLAFITAIVIFSIAEVNNHNSAALYGDNTPYSDWNVFVIISNAFSATANAEEYDLYAVEYNGEIYTYAAIYNSEAEIGAPDDENYIVVDGCVVYIRDIVNA